MSKVNIQTTISPYTQEPVCTRPLLSETELDNVVTAAVKAQKSWKKVSLDERIAIAEKWVVSCLCHLQDSTGKLTWIDRNGEYHRPHGGRLVSANGTVSLGCVARQAGLLILPDLSRLLKERSTELCTELDTSSRLLEIRSSQSLRPTAILKQSRK